MFMLADSSKRLSSMRAKRSKEKAEIVSAVEELNSVSSLCGLPPTNTEDVMSGVFPWSFDESEMALLGIFKSAISLDSLYLCFVTCFLYYIHVLFT